MSDRQIAKVKAGSPVAALVPTNIEEAFRISQAIAMSHMAPMIGPKNNRRPMGPEEVMATIMAGMEVGMKPMASLRAITLINGRPCFWGDGQLAIVQAHPDYAGMTEEYDEETETATCTVSRFIDGAVPETIRTFSRKDAEKANLWGKPGPWQEYPKRMLQHRARGFALRDAFSDALMGILSEAEAKDTPPDPDDLPMIEGDIVKDSPDDPTPYEEVDKIEVTSDGGQTYDSPQQDYEWENKDVQADRPDGDSEETGEPEEAEEVSGGESDDDNRGRDASGDDGRSEVSESSEREGVPTEGLTPAKLVYLVKSVHGGLYDKKTKKAVDNFYITNYKDQIEALPGSAQAIIEDVYFAHVQRVAGESTPEHCAGQTKEAIKKAEDWQ